MLPIPDSRYPFKATGGDASLPLLAQFLRSDSGRIATFLKTSLGGILHQEGSHWVVDPSANQGMEVNPNFLRAINQLAELSDIVFAQGDANVHFELMARPSRDVARMQLTLDEQNLDFFNQMESWQSFTWPGNTYYPGASLRWRKRYCVKAPKISVSSHGISRPGLAATVRKDWQKGYYCWSRCCPATANAVTHCALMPGKLHWNG